MTRPVLVTPNLDKEMRVEADTSEYAMGGVLSMKGEDNKWRPVAFILKSLNEVERNYEIHDREMLAIIRCLNEWQHLLEDIQNRLRYEVITKISNISWVVRSQIIDKQNRLFSY